MSACGIYFKNDMYQSEFESRRLNSMNVSEYLIITQMEMSGMWGTEIEVIALATLLKTTVAIYYQPPGAKVPLWHHYSPLCSDADTYMYLFAQYWKPFNCVKTVASGV